MKQAGLHLVSFALAALVAASGAQGGENGPPDRTPADITIKKGARFAILGDSITERRGYSAMMELYFTACAPQHGLVIMQFGKSSEMAPGFLARMDADLAPWRPDLATLCYGANDASAGGFQADYQKPFANATREIVQRLRKAGVQVVVGTGAVDAKMGQYHVLWEPRMPELSKALKKLAPETGAVFAELNGPMMDAMKKSRAALGEGYYVCGKDGLHPSPNGHLIMAGAFLQGLGMKGDIALITVDMKGAAAASEGHRILASAGGRAEIESTRYPYCFRGDDQSPESARSILPFYPFQQALNRFTLVVKNLDGDRATVVWGSEKRSFTRQELEKGVNLADVFIGKTPFEENFARVERAVDEKQTYDIEAMKASRNGEGKRREVYEVQAKKAAEVRALAAPVKHVIAIEKP